MRHKHQLSSCAVAILVHLIISGIGCSKSGVNQNAAASAADRSLLEVRITSTSTSSSEKITDATGRALYLSPAPLITARDVATALQGQDDRGQACLYLTLSKSGQQTMEERAPEYVGQTVAIFLSGQLVGTPTIMTPIKSQFVISDVSKLSASDLEVITRQLNERK